MKSLTVMIVPLIMLIFLFSYASAQERQTERRDAEPYFNRGLACSKKGQYDQAISNFNKALEINPSYALAYRNRGAAYLAKGQYDQAISDCTKTLDLDPRDAKVHFGRGVAYYGKKEYEKSWRDLEIAQSLGFQIPPKFLSDLRKVSGRQN